MPLRTLVLGGGNALGSYLPGVYQALHEAGELPDWIAGSSIGAITAALIAGNQPERRLERLHAYWQAASSPSWLPWARGDQWASALEARALGRPSLFHSRVPSLTGGLTQLGLYDAGPMRRLLSGLVDFGLLNSGAVRVSVLAVDLHTGAQVAFDTAKTRLTLDHIMASAALIPDFPPVCVDGHWLVDGGMAANTPADLVLPDCPEQETICYLADPFPAEARLPRSFSELSMRQTDLMFACQTARTVQRLEEAARHWPAGSPRVDIVRTAYAGIEEETVMKSWDFSQRSVAQRWQAGHADMAAAMHSLRAQRRVGGGLHVHKVVRAHTAEANAA